jgi:hypothetical protein
MQSFSTLREGSFSINGALGVNDRRISPPRLGRFWPLLRRRSASLCSVSIAAQSRRTEQEGAPGGNRIDPFAISAPYQSPEREQEGARRRTSPVTEQEGVVERGSQVGSQRCTSPFIRNRRARGNRTSLVERNMRALLARTESIHSPLGLEVAGRSTSRLLRFEPVALGATDVLPPNPPTPLRKRVR